MTGHNLFGELAIITDVIGGMVAAIGVLLTLLAADQAARKRLMATTGVALVALGVAALFVL